MLYYKKIRIIIIMNQEINCSQLSESINQMNIQTIKFDEQLHQRSAADAINLKEEICGLIQEINSGLYVEVNKKKIRKKEYEALLEFYKINFNYLNDESKSENINQPEIATEISLSEIDKLGHLKKVSVNWSQFKDITPLGKLTHLKELEFGKADNISDLSALSTLKELEIFWIESELIDDISVVENWPKLDRLILTTPNLKSIKPLGKCMKLVSLIINNSDVTDFSPLENITGLQALSIDRHKGTTVSIDSTFLSPLKNLTWLDMDKHDCDFGQIGSKKIWKMSISSKSLSDLSFLKDCNRLWQIHLYDCNISDISALSGKKFNILCLSKNPLVDLSPLKDCDMYRLEINDTNVTDLSPILDIKGLHDVYLSNTPALQDPAQQDNIKELRNRGVIIYD